VGFYVDQTGPHGYLRPYDGHFITIDVPGATDTRGRGINDLGIIAGQYTDASGATHAFVDILGVFSTIDVPGAAATFGRGINQLGDVAGNFIDGATGHTRGFVATAH